MSRLIDADVLEPDADYDDGEYRAVSMAQIENAPTIEPERKGMWVDGHRAGYGEALYWYIYCSECLWERNDDDHEKDTPYCPNCGSYNGESEHGDE